ncbi:ester cyclase [Nannocystaceae bacterium ST9]
MNHASARALIQPFYDLLTRPATKDVAAIVHALTRPDWRSYSGDEVSKTREQFIAQVGGFGKAIPDLTWTIRELFVDGDRVIVRSTATGTPAGEFMGVAHSGRSFAIMTIDVHTIVEGKLALAHHVEDWAGAIRQLAG